MTNLRQSSKAAELAALQEIRQLARERGGYFDGWRLAVIARIVREALDA